MRKFKPSRVLALFMILLLSGLIGCSGAGKNAAGLDKLYERESGRLLTGNGPQRRGIAGIENDDLAKDPHSLEAHGDNMALNGDFEGALFVYNRALLMAEKKQRQRLMGKAGELTLRQGRYAETKGIMDKLTRDDPTNANAWQSLGLALLSMNEKEKARKALIKAVAFNPNLWKAHNALGIIYDHDRQAHKALISFNRAIQKGPALAELFNNRALAHLLLKNLAQAEADWKRALAIKSDFKLAHNNLAILLAKKGDYQAAFSSFSKGSGKAEAHNNLGVMLAWRGKNQKAAKEFDLALKRLPLYYPKANSHLNQVAALSGSLKGPMVVDLTEDGYLVPADYRSVDPGVKRRSSRAKTHTPRIPAPKPLIAVLPGQIEGNKLKAPAGAENSGPDQPAKALPPKRATLTKKPVAKKEVKVKQEKNPVAEQQAPQKALDLSRFSAPRGAAPPLAGPENIGESLLRANPAGKAAALPSSNVLPAGADGSGEPECVLARQVVVNGGRSVWRGDVRALFRARD